MVKTTSTPAVDLARGLSDIWAFLSDTERQAIERQAIYQSFRKGEYIYRADEESVYLICILKGRVKLERAGVGGRNQIMRMLRSCEFFGYRSYFAAQGHITSAVAMESTTVACIPMGYPLHPETPLTTKLPYETLVHEETYRAYTDEEIDRAYAAVEAVPNNINIALGRNLNGTINFSSDSSTTAQEIGETIVATFGISFIKVPVSIATMIISSITLSL